jgi:hypothetical protein
VDAVSVSLVYCGFVGLLTFLAGLLIGHRLRPPARTVRPVRKPDPATLETEVSVSLVRIEWVALQNEFGRKVQLPVCTILRGEAEPEIWQRGSNYQWYRRSDARLAPFWLYPKLKEFVERHEALREIAATEVVSEPELPARRTPYRD